MSNRYVDVARTALQRSKRSLIASLRSGPAGLPSADVGGILEQLNDEGLVIIEGYLSPQQCDSLCQRVDSVLERYRDLIWCDPQDSDHRAFGADRVDEGVADFRNDPWLSELMKRYTNSASFSGLTLANRVRFRPGNVGSGGGWHKDTAKTRQFKAIVYLNDVNEFNGPFQYCTGSHRLSHALRGILQHGHRHQQDRFEGPVNAEALAAHEEIRTVVGQRGTLVLTDTSGIHRGKPIEEGTRYALTNYYWPGVNAVPSGFLDLMVDRQQSSEAA